MDRTFKSGQFSYILKDLCGRSLASLSPTYQCKHYVKIAIILIFLTPPLGNQFRVGIV